MKNSTLLLSFFLLAFGFTVNAQSLVLSGYSQTVYSNDSSATLSSYMSIENHAFVTESIMMDRTVINLVPGMGEQFCFGPKCYPQGTAASAFPAVIAGNSTNNSFIGDVVPKGLFGSNSIYYHFYDQNNISDSIGITLNFVFSSATGLSENKEEFGVSHPLRNPADAFTVFSYNLQTNEIGDKMVIYNMLGSLVKTMDIQGKNGTLVMSTAELKSGIYFASYISGNKVRETYKLVVAHH